MSAMLKVRDKGIVILPKKLRQKAGIEEGSFVTASAFDDGIILSPKETDAVAKLMGLARISKNVSSSSVRRVRSLRFRNDKELKLKHS